MTKHKDDCQCSECALKKSVLLSKTETPSELAGRVINAGDALNSKGMTRYTSEDIQFSGGALREDPGVRPSLSLASPFAIEGAIKSFLTSDITSYVSSGMSGSTYVVLSAMRTQALGKGDAIDSLDHLTDIMVCAMFMMDGELPEGTLPHKSLSRLGTWCAMGAKKYAPRNWEKGISFCRYIDSMIRHAILIEEGNRDEDHHAAILWNAMALYHHIELDQTEFDDRPPYKSQK